MMTFLDRINEDLKAAMKGRDSDRLSTLRMVKAALKNREIDKMEALTDEEAIKVLQSWSNNAAIASNNIKRPGV
jgi:uncharacterized protein YqeY